MAKKLIWLIPFVLIGYSCFRLATGWYPLALDIVTGIYYPWLNERYLNLTTATPVHNPYISDVTSQAVVWRQFLAERLQSLQSVFWHPYSLSGYPYLGSAYLTPLLHPTTLLLFIKPIARGISLVMLMQLAWLFIAAYLFFRAEAFTRSTSIWGALAITLGGQVATWFELGALAYVLAGMLLALAWIKRGRFGLLPWAVFLTVNGGHYQYVIYTLGIIVGYSLVRRVFRQTVPALAIGLGMSAIILIPTSVVYRQSMREHDQFLALRNQGLISLPHLVTLLTPDYYGNPATYNYTGEEDYQEKSGYMGILFIPLAIVALWFVRRHRDLAFFAVVTAGAALLMIRSPLSTWILSQPIPLLGNSKGSRPLAIFGIGLVILALFGYREITRSRPGRLFVGSLTVLLGIGLIILTLPTWNLAELLSYLHAPPLRDQAGAAVLTAFRSAVVSGGVAILGGSLLILSHWYRRLPVTTLLTLILLGDLGRYFLKYNTWTRRELYYPVTPEFAYLQSQAMSQKQPFRTEYYGTANVPMNIWEVYDLESASGYTSIYPRRYGEFVGIVNDDKINERPGRFVHVIRPQSPLFDLLTIRYVLVNQDDCPDGNGNNLVCQVINAPKFVRVMTHHNMALYENTRVSPRAFFASAYTVAPDDHTLAAALSRPDFDPSNVLLEQSPGDLPTALKPGEVTIDKTEPGRMMLGTTLAESGLLFIGNTYDPGWQARVDGMTTPVLRADYTFQAVVVPAGSHHVELTYVPPGIGLGSMISIATLVGYLGFFIMRRSRQEATS
jgi:hypothetical protein